MGLEQAVLLLVALVGLAILLPMMLCGVGATASIDPTAGSQGASQARACDS